MTVQNELGAGPTSVISAGAAFVEIWYRVHKRKSEGLRRLMVRYAFRPTDISDIPIFAWFSVWRIFILTVTAAVS